MLHRQSQAWRGDRRCCYRCCRLLRRTGARRCQPKQRSSCAWARLATFPPSQPRWRQLRRVRGYASAQDCRYKERLLLHKAVTLTADTAGSVTVEWLTSRPYESVLVCGGAACIVRGLAFRHASPSVANNFAIYNQGGDLQLRECDVSSATGSGLASEGGSVRLQRCSLHDCKGNGAALFADLEGGACEATIEGSSIVRNGLQGVLAREGTRLVLEGGEVSGNKLYGVLAQDSEVELRGTALAGNGKGGLRR